MEYSSWNFFFNDCLPEVGHRFVAIYNDGSGATLGYRHAGGFIDADGDELTLDHLFDAYSRWAYLPELTQLWCEIRKGDPLCFEGDITQNDR
jgi:hypothetical protein